MWPAEPSSVNCDPRGPFSFYLRPAEHFSSSCGPWEDLSLRPLVKGSSVNYVRLFLTPPSSFLMLLLQRPKYCCHKILESPPPLRQWCNLWTTPNIFKIMLSKVPFLKVLFVVRILVNYKNNTLINWTETRTFVLKFCLSILLQVPWMWSTVLNNIRIIF